MTFKLIRLASLLASLLLGSGCRSIQSHPARPISHSLQAAAGSSVLADLGAALPKGQSGLHLLTDNREALLWRLALADTATQSIDAQYFLWNEDHSGALLLYRLCLAADRGVRVRLMIDDFLLKDDDQIIADLCAHTNIQIRVFNPNPARLTHLGRRSRFMADLSQLNRRMHNKMMVADGRLAIVGGRNIGDEYFGLNRTYNFRDLDVLTGGRVLHEIGDSFDSYWNNPNAFPGEGLRPPCSEDDAAKRIASLSKRVAKDKQLSSYPVEPIDWRSEIEALPSVWHTGLAQFIWDDPEHPEARLVVDRLLRELPKGADGGELHIASPYFIPSQRVLQLLKELEGQGFETKILVPSLGANNHVAAHSHYRKYRGAVLDTGAELFEMDHQPSAETRAKSNVPPVESKFTALHLKALVSNRQRCFIGSLNLDPRALRINTENGLLIDSAGISEELAETIDELMEPANAWELTRDEKGDIRWRSEKGERSRQPARHLLQRLMDRIMRQIPIEGQL